MSASARAATPSRRARSTSSWSRARAGLAVVRLKGGDPFVFGRGGEELAFCEAAGLAVDVVPGVTAATGCAAGVGLPLTLRGVASAVTFVTGHHAGSGTEPDWAALAALDHTLVIYMGVAAARDRLGPPAAGVGRDEMPRLWRHAWPRATGAPMATRCSTR